MENISNDPKTSINKEEEKDRKLNSEEALNKVDTNPIQSSDVDGIVSERVTGSNPIDRAGIQDLDRGMARGSRRNS